MSKPKYRYCIELRADNPQREVLADHYTQTDDWLIFYRYPPHGGKNEHVRVRLAAVISLETHING